MKAQLKSDLHLNFSTPEDRFRLHSTDPNDDLKTSSEADVLLLVGDIIEYNQYDLFHAAFDTIKIPIIYVPGNHEHWHGTWENVSNEMKAHFQGTNVHVLDRDHIVIDDVVFIGATLFTPLNSTPTYGARKEWGEFELMKSSANKWGDKFTKDFEYIKYMLRNPDFKDMKKVVLTHYLPSMKSVPPQYTGNAMNMFFASNECEELMKDEFAPVIWAHGHTHDACDYKFGNTRVVCNPYGYHNSYEVGNNGFNPELILEI